MRQGTGTKRIRNSFLLLLTAIIWGSAFVAQSVGMDYVEPFTFTFARSIIGGIACGIALFAASNFQQIGITYTTVGKAGFITALYVVIVPILGLFMKKRVPFLVWICVGLSVVGLYLLCMTGESFTLAYGDFMVLICAVLFSFHILIIDYFSPRGDGVIISCIQFFVCGILSGIVMLFVENPSMGNMLDAKWSLLYAGVLSSGVAYTLQVVAQKDVNPTVASLILCLESVIAAVAGSWVLEEVLSTREKVGCLFMFVAIVLAQLPTPKKKKERV